MSLINPGALPYEPIEAFPRFAEKSSLAASILRWIAWSFFGVVALAFLWQPIGVGAQLGFATSVIVAMVLVRAFLRGPYMRWTFLALGSFVVLRYLYWRATQTLPDTDDLVDFSFGTLLALAELYCAYVLAVSLVINADPVTRSDAPAVPDHDLPAVDVFIPSYDEDPEILAMTIAAARSMDYPASKLTVWLLDDGGTDQKCADPDPVKARKSKSRRASLRMLCDDLGANYLTRARNEHAKAGNLNNGLAHSKAPIVVVFDADHVPFKSFLRETIGHFSRDPKLFLVQTPHVFLNRDPVERNLRTFDQMPSENEMFYAVTQRGLDKWNGSFFCGSAAVLRRTALNQTGGFSGLTVTEDCETAFELHRSGWTSVYVDKPLTAGLQPETFESFIGQRSRWCQGMFQLFLMKSPLFKRGLKPIQRVAYLSSMTYWFFPLPRLIFMFAPLLHIFFDVKLFVSTVEELVAYVATYIIVNAMMHNHLYGHVRWPWMSELYEYVQGIYLIKAIASVIASPKKPTFNVTAKGISLDSDHLSPLAWPFLIAFVILLAGVVTAGWRYAFEPGVNGVMLVVGLWALFNLIIAAAALGVVAERRELRKYPRLKVARRGRVSFEDYAAEVEIVNVSAGGCAIRVPGAAFFGSSVLVGTSRGRLTIEGVGGRGESRALEVTMVRAENRMGSAIVGLKYEIRTAADYLALADLMYGDADALAKFLTARRRHMGIVRGTLVFLRWAVTEPFRAYYYLFTGRRAKIAGDDEPADQDAIARQGGAHHRCDRRSRTADRGARRWHGAHRVALGRSEGGERRAAAERHGEPLAGFGLVDPAPVPGR